MKRFIALSLVLAACGAGQTAPSTKNAPTAATAPSTDVLPPYVLDNPDSAMRYHYPIAREPSRMPALAPEEIRLSNGMRALLVSRNDAPVVFVDVVVRWKGPLPIHSLPVAAVLLDAAGKQAKSLVETMGERGVNLKMDALNAESNTFEFETAPSLLESAFAGMFESWSHPLSPAENLESIRSRLPKESSKGKNSMRGRIHETFFPAGSPYHNFGRLPDPATLQLEDIVRLRDTELGPESIRICVVGNVSRSALEEMLTRTSQNWKSPGGVARKIESSTKAPLGTFLFEAPADDSGGAIVLPSPLTTDPDYVPFTLAWNLADILQSDLRKAEDGPYSSEKMLYVGTALRLLRIEGDTAHVSTLAHQMTGALKRVAAGEFSAEELVRARRGLMQWSTRQRETFPNIAAILADTVAFDGDVEFATKIYNGSIDTSKEQIVQAAQKWLRKSEIRIVAAGKADELKKALEDLDIRPMNIVSSPGKKK